MHIHIHSFRNAKRRSKCSLWLFSGPPGAKFLLWQNSGESHDADVDCESDTPHVADIVPYPVSLLFSFSPCRLLIVVKGYALRPQFTCGT